MFYDNPCKNNSRLQNSAKRNCGFVVHMHSFYGCQQYYHMYYHRLVAPAATTGAHMELPSPSACRRVIARRLVRICRIQPGIGSRAKTVPGLPIGQDMEVPFASVRNGALMGKPPRRVAAWMHATTRRHMDPAGFSPNRTRFEYLAMPRPSPAGIRCRYLAAVWPTASRATSSCDALRWGPLVSSLVT